jgi:uncharacterized protein
MAGLALYVVTAARQLPAAALPFGPVPTTAASAASSPPDSSALAARKSRIATDISDATRSWSGAARLNARSYLRVLAGDARLIPQTLGLMMIGLALFKAGFFVAGWSTDRYASLIGLGAAALAITGWLCWREDVLAGPVPGGHAALLFLAPFASLAYASSLILLLRGAAAKWLAPLAATGRMAFTNYVMQSVLMTSIFYGGRGAWMGRVDRPGLWLIVFAVWALQLTLSPSWLARFEMGPLEWIWRCLTVGHFVPLLKPRSA